MGKIAHGRAVFLRGEGEFGKRGKRGGKRLVIGGLE